MGQPSLRGQPTSCGWDAPISTADSPSLNSGAQGSVSSTPAGETPWCVISWARLLAMTLCFGAVAEVDREPDRQPDEQPHPVLPRKREHQEQAGDDAEDRRERHERRLERPGGVGCVFRMISTAAQTITNASNVPMLTSSARMRKRQESRQGRDEDARQDRRLPRRAELLVNRAEEARRHQAVARHREQHARLAEHHHEQHRGDAGDRADGDQELRPRQADLARRRRRPGRRC